MSTHGRGCAGSDGAATRPATDPVGRGARRAALLLAGRAVARARRVPFFAGLTEAQLAAVNARCGIWHRDAGEAVHRIGQPAERLHVIVVGAVKLTRPRPDGSELLLDVIGQGDFVGSVPVLGESRYADSAWALAPVCLLSISQATFDWVLRTYPTVARAALAVVAQRLRRALATVERLSSATAEQRVVQTILVLADRLGVQRGDRLVINVPLARDELASLAGCASETASRVITKLRRAELFDAGRRWIAVCDLDGLRELG